jgi:hypothetical protein
MQSAQPHGIVERVSTQGLERDFHLLLAVRSKRRGVVAEPLKKANGFRIRRRPPMPQIEWNKR